MGILGLTSFINREFKDWRNEEVSGKLVIDGYSLMFCIHTCDWTHGGQYPEFRETLRRFFRQLKRSKIDVVVVMDGVDVEGKKESVIVKRKREAIRTIDRFCGRERRSFATGSGVLPPHTLNVFIALLHEMKVELVFADGEGDVTVFEIARGYGCPVLSNDSDFFMYEMEGGFIPINRFHWEHSMPVRADVYYYKHFCKAFKMADLKLRLVIPAIAGNDFISAINDAQFSEYIYQSSPSNVCQYRISMWAIVDFLKKFTSLAVFKDSIKTFPNLEQHVIRTIEENCQQSEESYNSNKVSTPEDLRKSTTLRACGSAEIPDWVLKQFRNGNFLSMYALASGGTMLNSYIEDTRKPTCTLVSKPIRTFTYGLMGQKKVREMTREGLDLGEENMAGTASLNGNPLPSLEKMSSLSQSERARLFYSMLGCGDDGELVINSLDDKWHLVVATTRYWVKACSPRSLEVNMLVLCFVMLHFNRMKPLRLESELEQFRKTDQWMEVLHVLAQWQSCYGDSSYLNQILMLPLQPVSPADLYDGVVLMFLINHGHDDELMRYLLKDQELRLYQELMDAVMEAKSSSDGKRRPTAGSVRPNRGGSGPPQHSSSYRGYAARSTDPSRYFCDGSRYGDDRRRCGDGVDGGRDVGGHSTGAGWRQHTEGRDYDREQQQDRHRHHGWREHGDYRHGDKDYHASHYRGDRGHPRFNYGYHGDRRYHGDGYHSDQKYHGDGYRGDQRYHRDAHHRDGYRDDQRFHGDGGYSDRRYHGDRANYGDGYHGDRGYYGGRGHGDVRGGYRNDHGHPSRNHHQYTVRSHTHHSSNDLDSRAP